MIPHKINAVTVNHNTSAYLELMLRSLCSHHPEGLNFTLTIYDNASQDDLSSITAFADSKGFTLRQSGHTTKTIHNSHGEILSRFVLENVDCSHYLFLDSDICFLEDQTIHWMMSELENNSSAFGIMPRMSWDGKDEIPEEILNENPDIYQARLHPCCALVKNSPLFRTVVKEVSLSVSKIVWSDYEEYLDTFKLMTRVMKTHNLQHILSSVMILHFFSVSYPWEPSKQWEKEKSNRRDTLLEKYRNENHDSFRK